MSSGSSLEVSQVPASPTRGAMTGRRRLAGEVDWILRLLIGGIFIWSGAAHLANPYYFLSTVYQYQLTSAEVGALIASYLPFLELTLAICLLGGLCRRPVWVLTALLLVLFVVAQSSALARGLKISCGCFGPEINRPVDKTSVGFTSVLAVLAIGATIASLRTPGKSAAERG
jgi:uncharacterized membrane protein YphA (DoxX/SURF4 family)